MTSSLPDSCCTLYKREYSNANDDTRWAIYNYIDFFALVSNKPKKKLQNFSSQIKRGIFFCQKFISSVFTVHQQFFLTGLVCFPIFWIWQFHIFYFRNGMSFKTKQMHCKNLDSVRYQIFRFMEMMLVQVIACVGFTEIQYVICERYAFPIAIAR